MLQNYGLNKNWMMDPKLKTFAESIFMNILKNKEGEDNKRIKRKLLPNIKQKLEAKLKPYARRNKFKLEKMKQDYVRRLPLNIERRLVPEMMAYAEVHNLKYNKWFVIPYII